MMNVLFGTRIDFSMKVKELELSMKFHPNEAREDISSQYHTRDKSPLKETAKEDVSNLMVDPPNVSATPTPPPLILAQKQSETGDATLSDPVTALDTIRVGVESETVVHPNLKQSLSASQDISVMISPQTLMNMVDATILPSTPLPQPHAVLGKPSISPVPLPTSILSKTHIPPITPVKKSSSYYPVIPNINIIPIPSTSTSVIDSCTSMSLPDLVVAATTTLVSPHRSQRALNFGCTPSSTSIQKRSDGVESISPQVAIVDPVPGTSVDVPVIIEPQSHLPDLGQNLNLNWVEEREVDEIMQSNFPSSDEICEITPFNDAQYLLSDDQKRADRMTLKRANTLVEYDDDDVDDDFVKTRPPKRGSILNRCISDIVSPSDEEEYIPQTQIPRVKYHV